VGALAAPSAFAFTLPQVSLGSGERTSGIAGVVEAVALALVLLVLAGLAAAAITAAAVWLGSALGCGLALRLTRQGHARRTALVLAGVEPPVVLAVLGLLRAVGLQHVAHLAVALSVAASACLARWLADPGGPDARARSALDEGDHAGRAPGTGHDRQRPGHEHGTGGR
jgi:hypothetical protein